MDTAEHGQDNIFHLKMHLLSTSKCENKTNGASLSQEELLSGRLPNICPLEVCYSTAAHAKPQAARTWMKRGGDTCASELNVLSLFHMSVWLQPMALWGCPGWVGRKRGEVIDLDEAEGRSGLERAEEAACCASFTSSYTSADLYSAQPLSPRTVRLTGTSSNTDQGHCSIDRQMVGDCTEKKICIWRFKSPVCQIWPDL